MRKENDIVIQLVKKYKTTDVYQLCDCLNVDVRFVNIGSLRGFYRYIRRNKFIVINKNLPEMQKEFVCAHELGHLMLHKDANRILMDTNIHIPNRYENEANRFAIYLTSYNIDTEDFNINYISNTYNIPIEYLCNLNIF